MCWRIVVNSRFAAPLPAKLARNRSPLEIDTLRLFVRSVSPAKNGENCENDENGGEAGRFTAEADCQSLVSTSTA